MNLASSLKRSKTAKLITLTIGLSALSMSGAWAKAEIGKTLPAVDVKDRGELSLDAGGDVNYQPWSTKSLNAGTVTIVMHLPARYSSEKDIDPLRDALEAKSYTPKTLRAVSVINLDDAMFGASAFINGELKKNKLKQPNAIFVVDADGKAFKTWDLKKKQNAVIILDKNNTVVYRHIGKYDSAEVEKAISLIDRLNKTGLNLNAELKASVGLTAK